MAAGLSDVETFIASGNVIFSSPVTDTAALERRIESALAKAATRRDLRAHARGARGDCGAHALQRRSRDVRRRAPHHFLAQSLPAASRKEVAALSAPGDELSSKGREIYWGRFGKLSESPLFAKSLGKTASAGTMRNRNTVVQLLARLQAGPARPAAGRRRSKKELP